MSIGRLIDGLETLGLVTRASLEGCSPAEIAAVERGAGVPLPRMYKDFLAVMGRRAGSHFMGADLLYPKVLKLRSDALELLGENPGSPELPKDAVVIDMHEQGYEFMFMRGNEGEDPPVYRYAEGSVDFPLVSDRFSNYLLRRLS